jgi:uncharacterized membrane protein (UPF0127 family)
MRRIVALVVGAAALLAACGGGSGSEPVGHGLEEALRAARPVTERFPGFTETRLAVGDDCLRVVIADQDAEKVQGLRGVRTLAPFDGMLFAFDSESRARFTMAGALIPLTIGFYDADGRPRGRLEMQPCPEGTDRTCPVYDPKAAFRFALETAAGQLGSGPLGGCA